MIRTLLLLLLPTALLADVPRKPSESRYTALWNPSSPFTTKPVVEGRVPDETSPLDDYALGGVSKLEDGYFVVLLNRKEPDKRLVIEPGITSDFEVVSVQWDMSGGKGTTVKIKSAGDTKDIGYDEELMAKKQQQAAAAAAKPNPQPQVPGLPAALQKPTATPTGVRPPRPRVARPPTPRPTTGAGTPGQR
jgi:hypothetical protein